MNSGRVLGKHTHAGVKIEFNIHNNLIKTTNTETPRKTHFVIVIKTQATDFRVAVINFTLAKLTETLKLYANNDIYYGNKTKKN